MKVKLFLIGLVAYILFEGTKPTYPVEINEFQCLLIAVGMLPVVLFILWAVLSLILFLTERGK